jgi:mRNA interferase MazF
VREDVDAIATAPGDYGKPRPAVVVQSGLFNGTHSSVAVCLITTHLQDAPLFRIPVPAGRMTGLKLESQVMVDKVIAIPRNKITGRAGALAAGPLKEIDSALRLWAGTCLKSLYYLVGQLGKLRAGCLPAQLPRLRTLYDPW